TVEDESLFTNSYIELTYKNDVEAAQRSVQTNFEANFSRISVEMLKFFCYKMGLFEASSKQDLVNHLVIEYKKRDVLVGSDNAVKGKSVDVDDDIKELSGEDSKFSYEIGKAFQISLTGVLLDKALFSGNVEYVQLARQVVLERAYVVRVADKDGWNVAARMILSDLFDLINTGMSNRFISFKQVVYYLCEEKRHYANKCESRKHMDSLFRGESAKLQRS
ncbi:7421_t:CDS:2, partial [Racocetra fulgida]